MLGENRDLKPARNYFGGHETLMYSSLSAAPFSSLTFSAESSALSTTTAAAVAAHGLTVELGLLGELVAARAKQTTGIKGGHHHYIRHRQSHSIVVANRYILAPKTSSP